jgi:hypothetical protein
MMRAIHVPSLTEEHGSRTGPRNQLNFLNHFLKRQAKHAMGPGAMGTGKLCRHHRRNCRPMADS